MGGRELFGGENVAQIETSSKRKLVSASILSAAVLH